MSEVLLVRHCSTTPAGIKTGSLFTCSYRGEDELRDALRRFSRMLGKKGLYTLSIIKMILSKAFIYLLDLAYCKYNS